MGFVVLCRKSGDGLRYMFFIVYHQFIPRLSLTAHAVSVVFGLPARGYGFKFRKTWPRARFLLYIRDVLFDVLGVDNQVGGLSD